MGRGSSGTGGRPSGGGSGGSDTGGGASYKGRTADSRGVYAMGSGATESEALDIANNAPFTETQYGKSLGVSVNDSYKVENRDGSITQASRNAEYRVSYSQNSDGTWSTSGTGTSSDSKSFKSEAAAQRNARKALARDMSEEVSWGRTLSMRTGNWKRR